MSNVSVLSLTPDQLELQWFDDVSWRWVPYVQMNQLEIRKHISDNKMSSENALSSPDLVSLANLASLPTLHLTVPGIGHYKLDFSRMQQVNEATLFERRIRFINVVTRQEVSSNNQGQSAMMIDNDYDNEDEEVEPDDDERQEDEYVMDENDEKDEKKEMFMQIPFSSIAATDQCVLCFESFTSTDNILIPVNCTGHFFHKKCPGMDMGIEDYMKKTKQCPACKKRYGIVTGNMPRGKMLVNRLDMHLPGFEKNKTLEITFDFPSGRQGDDHPNPGARYSSDHRVAYLPDSEEGKHVLSLLKKAWNRKLLFTIGTSVTRGLDGCIIYNGVHFKSVPYATPSEPWGWPDPTYLHRVVQELNEKGVY